MGCACTELDGLFKGANLLSLNERLSKMFARVMFLGFGAGLGLKFFDVSEVWGYRYMHKPLLPSLEDEWDVCSALLDCRSKLHL